MTTRIPRSRNARRAMAATGATALLATPATLALGATGPVLIDSHPLQAPLAGHLQISEHLSETGHRLALHRVLRVARKVARTRGHRLPFGYAHRWQGWSAARLDRTERRLRRQLRSLRRAQAAVSPALEAIAACESGGNPRAIGGGGAYRGKYQFSYGAWAAVGGSGDPAAASVAEQDKRASLLYARSGPGQWPVCGQ